MIKITFDQIPRRSRISESCNTGSAGILPASKNNHSNLQLLEMRPPELWQVFAVGFEEFAGEAADAGQGEQRTGEGVHGHGLFNVGWITRLGTQHGEFLDIDIGPVQCSALWRQRAGACWLDAIAVHQTRDLDAGIAREVGDKDSAV